MHVQERRVSAPHLPPSQCYKPIKELLRAVRDGQRFVPVTVAQISKLLGGSGNALASAHSAHSDVSAESIGPKSPPRTDPSAASSAHQSFPNVSAAAAEGDASGMRSAQLQPVVGNSHLKESLGHEMAASQSAPRESGRPAAAEAPLPSPAKPGQPTAGPSHPGVSLAAGAASANSAKPEHDTAASQLDKSSAREPIAPQLIPEHVEQPTAAEAAGGNSAEPGQNATLGKVEEGPADETAALAVRSLHAADAATAPDIVSTATADVSATEPMSVLKMELDKLNAQAERAAILSGATAHGSASAGPTPSNPIRPPVPISDAARPDDMTAPSPASATQTSHTSIVLPAAGQQGASVSGLSSGAQQLPADAAATTSPPSIGQGPSDGLEGVSAEARQQLQQLTGLGASIIALPDKREGAMRQSTAALSSSGDASAHADAAPVAAGSGNDKNSASSAAVPGGIEGASAAQNLASSTPSTWQACTVRGSGSWFRATWHAGSSSRWARGGSTTPSPHDACEHREDCHEEGTLLQHLVLKFLS